MDYENLDSSGTNDDYPPSHQNHGHIGGYMNGNGQTNGGNPLQNDIERQIRRLELEAYSSVLRAFKAQSDAITWEKEGVITDLRKELRVSDEEHRRFLSKVNAEDTIRRIREWRQEGGVHSGLMNHAYTNHSSVVSPSSAHKRPRTSQAIPAMVVGTSVTALLEEAVTAPIQPSATTAKQVTAAGAKSKKAKQCPSSGASGRGQVVPRNSAAAPATTGSFQQADNESLIGRKVMTRWPEDNNFYEAFISAYNAKEGLHYLIYDMNTANETWEWVNLKEIADEDIRWVGYEPAFSDRVGKNGPSSGAKKSQRVSGVTNDTGRGKGSPKNQFKKDYIPSQNGHRNNNVEDFEILNTEILLKEVENIFAASHPNPLDIEKAKKMLREHEQSLIDAIAKLADISDGESEDDDQFLHAKTSNGNRARMNHQQSENQQGANYGFVGQEGSDDAQG